jgi:hypothetical protein
MTTNPHARTRQLERRRTLLASALGFAQLTWRSRVPPAAGILTGWLDSWFGVGAVLGGMTAQGYNVELKEFPEGWRASFYPVGVAHSIVAGSAYEPTAWAAVQRAACEALSKACPG